MALRSSGTDAQFLRNMHDYPIVTKFASALAFHYPLAIYSVLVPIVGSRTVKHSVSSPTRYYLSAIAIVAVPSVDYPFVVPPFLFQGLYSPLAIVDCFFCIPLASILASIISRSLSDTRKLIVGCLCTPLIDCPPHSPALACLPVLPAYSDINVNKYLMLFLSFHVPVVLLLPMAEIQAPPEVMRENDIRRDIYRNY